MPSRKGFELDDYQVKNGTNINDEWVKGSNPWLSLYVFWVKALIFCANPNWQIFSKNNLVLSKWELLFSPSIFSKVIINSLDENPSSVCSSNK